ncbi:uncharacterized protein BJ171DRAFT_573003 [Polychytrium aggregatum]|uniref:uncharacterized protein n=1 Tax=Polychytrium aggregatum TaxID=110093 RepID=UPI0022FF0912|nr:uncharacterized protein BJ171DRAFT_573003 [Polychytrium aggregatum]KAI9193157.1 hypothetical protein BJ171DRAFT_573003 [Polychytrium aggregatum]
MSSHLASLEISSTAANQAAVAKKFVCEYPACGKAFATSGHLSRHAKAHSGLKPYSCPIPNCTSKFSRHDNMLQHYRSHAKKIWCSSIPANAPPLRRRPYTKRANPDQQQQQQQQQATRPEAISLPRGQSPPNSVSPTASVHHHSLSRPYPEHGPAEAYAFPNHGYYSPPSPSIRLTDDSVDRRASFSPSASHSHFVRYPHPHPHSVEAASHSRYNHDFPTKLRELSAPALPSVSSVSSPSSERLLPRPVRLSAHS